MAQFAHLLFAAVMENAFRAGAASAVQSYNYDINIMMYKDSMKRLFRLNARSSFQCRPWNKGCVRFGTAPL